MSLAAAEMSSGSDSHNMASTNKRDLIGEAASLDVNGFEEVLKQLTDFNSSNPKSPLVHELNVRASKDESLLSKPESSSLQSRHRKAKQASIKSTRTPLANDQRVDRCSSLQDLADSASTSTQGNQARKKLSKSKRANSFSADSKGQVKLKAGQNKRNSKTQPSSPCPPDSSTNPNKKTANDSNNNHSNSNTNTTTNNNTINTNNNNNNNHNRHLSFNTCDCDAQVESTLGDSSSTQPPPSSLASNHSINSSTGVVRSQQQQPTSNNHQSSTFDEEIEEGALESQDYRRRLQLVNVNYLKENSNEANTLFQLSNFVAGPLCDTNRSTNGVDKIVDHRDPSNNGE